MMRRLIIVSALVLSSSVAFAQFTGPSVERDSQTRRDNMGQWQDRPCMNAENGQPCEFREHMNMRSDGNRADGNRANGPRRSQMNHQGYHRDGSRGDHRQYHNNGPRHGDMRQHSGHRQQMHQGNGSEHRSQMHQGPRSEHRDQMHRGQGRHFNNR